VCGDNRCPGTAKGKLKAAGGGLPLFLVKTEN